MKGYYLDCLDKKEKYNEFTNIMVDYSDSFSVVYFKYREEENDSKGVTIVKKELNKEKIFETLTCRWPGTSVINDFHHIYMYTVYRANNSSKKVLSRVKSLFKWDYPEYPMDLCFYKDGYCIFESSAHEKYCRLLCNDDALVKKLEAACIIDENTDYTDVDDNYLFYEERTIVNQQQNV